MESGHLERKALCGVWERMVTSKQSPKSMCRIFPLSRSSIKLDGCLGNRRETGERSLEQHWWINQQGCDIPGPVHRPKPAPACFCKQSSTGHSRADWSRFVSGCFCATIADMSSCETSYGQQRLNYFLSGPLQGKFADPRSRSETKVYLCESQVAFPRSLVTR